MNRMKRVTLGALCALSLSACVDQAPPADYGDPTNLAVATTQGGITAQVLSPQLTDEWSSPIAKVELVAYTTPPVPLELVITTTEGYVFTATATGAPGPEQRFVADVPLLHGSNVLDLRITEIGGLRSRRLRATASYAGSAPGLRFGLYDDRDGTACGTVLPVDVTAADVVCVKGRGTADGGTLASLVAGLDGESPSSVTFDANGFFEALLPLPADTTRGVVVTVTSSGGSSSTASRSVIQDSTAPTLSAPLAEGGPTRTDALRILVQGTVTDANGVGSLRLENAAGGVVKLPATSPFAREVQLLPGENAFELVAEDVAGNEARLPFVVIRDRLIRLRAPGSPGNATLNLDRDALDELLTVQDQIETDLVEISLRTAVLQSLYSIRDPELFDVDTSSWGQPEWNLNNLLNMTPDTADLSGSSLAELLDIAPAVGLPSPRLLAELLALEPTDTFVDLEITAGVVLDQLVATHPNISFDAMGKPVLKLTMYDVLNDLSPLTGRFGPSGAHPGFLSGQISSEVFEPGFLMSIPAKSNLAPYQGVDASAGSKDYFFVLTGGDLLELDFLSPDFSVVGLVDEPTVDMRFTLGESASFFGVATTRTAGADAANPGFYRGNSPVWSASPWLMERIVAETAYRQYRPLFPSSYTRTLSYDAGSITNAAVIDWNRGWVTITTSGGIGNPPPPTYVWDVLNEVAQLRLHNGGVPEGGVQLAFTLTDLPIGLDAAGLIERLRPTLQAQSSELANRLVSPEGLVASGVDFYFVPANDGGPGFLFFRAPGDASGTYAYAKPGFFTNATLTTKASSLAPLAGTDDATHEKLVPVVGAILFFADDGGQVYQLEIVTVDAEGVELRVTPYVGEMP